MNFLKKEMLKCFTKTYIRKAQNKNRNSHSTQRIHSNQITLPVPVTREAWPWNLPRRLATVQCAMTMPQATITEFGLARAVRPSSREVFKVIVCCKQVIPFFNPKRGSDRGRHMISHLYKTLIPSESTSIYDRNMEKR